ncbi:hypothetical protein KPH14_002887 [Odynerus spinipes]|uniref:Uncharacterized protein n=1 Tax=Odynerus spinipes TaxID=1348599 RepID=A0AAD9RWV1_9HYME|nr:hypothetical protein KPH14_002887 [Odynerus spinipes]
MTTRPQYRILTLPQPPFTIYDKTTGLWSGFCIDLIKDLEKILNFTYEIREPYDNKYGDLNFTTMEWNGMIRELMDGTADMIVAPMWMTSARGRVVDFTEPFYPKNGISFVMRDNRRNVPFFRFLMILEPAVWLSFFGVFLLTSLLLYFLERFSPYSYRNRAEKYKNEADERFCRLKECFWFVLTSLISGAEGEMPKNVSGKLCVVTWWLFGFIISAAYTANLAAYQTLLRMEKHVESLSDLRRQYQIEYSAVYGSATHEYFVSMVEVEKILYEKWKSMSLNESMSTWERSKLSVWEYPFDDSYTKMLAAMETAGFAQTTEEAVARVRGINQTKPFALVIQEMLVQYLVLTTCDLISVGEEFSKKPFAIAVQQGSPLKSSLNIAIRKLYAERRILELKRKWWEENPARILCGSNPGLNDGIGMDYMAAVFSLILLGIALTVAILCVQYWWYYYVPRAVLQNSKRRITITHVISGEIDTART